MSINLFSIGRVLIGRFTDPFKRKIVNSFMAGFTFRRIKNDKRILDFLRETN